MQTQADRRFLQDAKATEHWLAGLSGTRIGTTARELYKALKDFNRIQLQPRQRQPILQVFLEPVYSSCRSLEAYYLNKTFPLDNNILKIAQINKALKLELALCFKILLRDLLKEPTPKQVLAQALQGALTLHLSILRQEALTYRSYPRLFWKETNQLFLLALTHDLQSLDVSLALSETQAPTTIEDSYRQITLASLSDHYRLRQLEIIRLFSLLPEFSAKVQFSEEDDQRQQNRFIILLEHNLPALPVAQAKTEVLRNKKSLFLQTDTLIATLKTIESKLKYNNLSGELEYHGLSQRTFLHLQQVWSIMPTRHSPRTNLYFELDLVLGLKLIYKRQVEARNAQMDSQLNIRSSLLSFLHSEGSEMQIDLHSGFWDDQPLNITHINEQDYQDSGTGKTEADKNQHNSSHQRFQIVNESEGGYCLSWNSNGTHSIKIGELLGIRQKEHSEHLDIAICRWIKQEQDGGMLGISLLSRIALPVEARLLEPEDSLIHQCLILEKASDTGHSRILTPPLAFRSGQRLALFQGQALIQIQLLDLLEASTSFNLFSYEQSELTEEDEAPALP